MLRKFSRLTALTTFIFLLAVATITTPIFSLLAFNNLGPLVDIGLQKLVTAIVGKGGDIAAIYFALIFGTALFAVRKWILPLYAFIEVFFGMYGAGIALLLLCQPKALPEGFQKLAPSSTSYPQYVGLISSIYVIVRGLDNCERWIKEKEKRRSRNVQT